MKSVTFRLDRLCLMMRGNYLPRASLSSETEGGSMTTTVNIISGIAVILLKLRNLGWRRT